MGRRRESELDIEQTLPWDLWESGDSAATAQELRSYEDECADVLLADVDHVESLALVWEAIRATNHERLKKEPDPSQNLLREYRDEYKYYYEDEVKDEVDNLGVRLGRFEQTGSVDELNRAVEVTSMALDATPQNHPDRASILSNLGTLLSKRFEWTGLIDDINQAIEVANMAVDDIPQDHHDRASILSNLGTLLSKRFKWTGSEDDLNRAIDVTNIAVNATPQNHPDRVGILSNLGNLLGRRFERTGSMHDMNQAIEVANIAVDATPQDHLNRASILSNLGTLLAKQFEWTESIDDLNRAIDVTKIAIDATPQNHPDRAGYLNDIGTWLGRRFNQTGSKDDLNLAIEVANIAVDTTPREYPDRAGYLNNLGNLLVSRYKLTGSRDDYNYALLSYREGYECVTAPPSIRIRLARSAASIFASQANWKESSQLLQGAVNLLSTVSPQSLKHTDKLHILANFTGLASLAAAIALNAGEKVYHALQLLELGRGIITGPLMEMRGDISRLKEQHPSLADEFTSLRDELDIPANRTTSLISTADMPSWESQARRLYETQKFNELIIKIRACPGFERFLLLSTADEWMAAANQGPIIIVNLSSYRCDAFLIERYQIRVLKLPDLTLEEVQKQTREMRSSEPITTCYSTPMLEWLWDAVCRPVLDTLGFKNPISDDNWPRVWWIPTGLLSQLPLHAAGRHKRGSTETVLDRVMSSYASSVRALIYGRRQQNRTRPLSGYALMVEMEYTPSFRRLPFVHTEAAIVKDLCLSLQLKPIMPIRQKDSILQHLSSCDIFHFAGHAKSDTYEPLQSSLLLDDWESNPLTVADIHNLRLQENPPFLAYLSATSTGATKSDRLVDEGIHLVSAFQLAGFRHVIGTLWGVSDSYCVDVARVLYETLRHEGITDAAVCRGLHKAIRVLRDREIKELEANDGETKDGETSGATVVHYRMQDPEMTSTQWIQYVHFGV
ncbi:TPR-like protein [Thozetella sp. PMI_491]|nr:TPR-like protein [Thozetella sp. PMI_491]